MLDQPLKVKVSLFILVAFFTMQTYSDPTSLDLKKEPITNADEMDFLANYRLLAQGHDQNNKYLLFEKSYRHWSQLILMTRANSNGPYTEKIIDVPLSLIDEIIARNKLDTIRHLLNYSESLWIKEKNIFLVRISLTFEDGKDVYLLANLNISNNQFLVNDKSWKQRLPGEPDLVLSDE
jgi:hypothetical protein